MTGEGLARVWCGAAARLVLITVPNMRERAGPEKGRTRKGL